MSVGGDAVTGVAGGAGTLDVMASGAVTVASDVTVFPTGQVRLAGGTLTAGEIRFQGAGGQFNWTSGTLQLGAYRGSLVNAAGLLESRGLISTVTIDNNYTQQAGGTLRVGIGGPTPNTSYDVVNVGGTAVLDGLLEIQQVAGYMPDAESDLYRARRGGDHRRVRQRGERPAVASIGRRDKWLVYCELRRRKRV